MLIANRQTKRLDSTIRRRHQKPNKGVRPHWIRSTLSIFYWGGLASVLSFCVLGPAYSESHFEITPNVDHLIRNGQLAMYNCDYDGADRKFDELVRKFPDHPAGYMYKAEVVWWKALRDTTSKGLESQFDQYTDPAVRFGEALTKKDPKNFYAWYFLASAYGNKTRFYVTVSKRNLGAMRAGLKGRYCNENALALRPSCVDCLIGTGAFNYFAGALPAVIKPFAWMLGASGDKEKGLKQLETAAEKGVLGQTEARTVLLGVYYNERRFDDYRTLIMRLIDQFPPNHVFYMWLANHCIAEHQYDQGIEFFTSLLERPEKSGPRISTGYAHYEKGRLELQKGAFDKAVSTFTRAIETGEKDKNLLAQAHLMRAFALDSKGDRSSALQDYRSVMSLPNVNETQRLATRFSKKPYRGRL